MFRFKNNPMSIQELRRCITGLYPCLAYSEQRSLNIFFNLLKDDSGIIVRMGDKITDCNQRFCQIIGQDYPAVLGSRLVDLPGLSLPVIKEIQKRTLIRDEAAYIIEYLCRNGQIQNLLCKAVNLFSDGSPARLSVINRL